MKNLTNENSSKQEQNAEGITNDMNKNTEKPQKIKPEEQQKKEQKK